MLLLVLQQHGLTQQVTQRQSKRPRHIGQDIKPTNLPLATLDLAQPVLSTAHQVRENNLRQSATTPVKGNTLTNAELITRPTHDHTLAAASTPPGHQLGRPVHAFVQPTQVTTHYRRPTLTKLINLG